MMGWLLASGGVLAGAAIGFLGGLLGIGGGLIAIPSLGLLLGMSQQMAQGTALILVLPTVLMSLRKYNQQSPIDRGVAMSGALSAVGFTWVGAHLALGLDSSFMRQSFAVFLLAIACFYVWQTFRRVRVHKTPRFTFGRPQAFVLGVVAGTLGGFFGVGGAILAVPIMTVLFGLSQTVAQGLALTMIIPGAIVALMTYTLAGQADWTVGVLLAAGSLTCVPTGVRLAYRLPERSLRLAFATLLFLTVPLLLYHP